jgi:hypothetical protein
MKKIIIEGFRLNDNVLITSYNPPIKGKVIDMYELESTMIPDESLKRLYPKTVPVFEIVLEDGKLRQFVKDVVKKA